MHLHSAAKVCSKLSKVKEDALVHMALGLEERIHDVACFVVCCIALAVRGTLSVFELGCEPHDDVKFLPLCDFGVVLDGADDQVT